MTPDITKILKEKVERSAKETEELLEVFGEKCKYHGLSTDKSLLRNVNLFWKISIFYFHIGLYISVSFESWLV